ncbi:hypothetical protein [Streptomyces sp. NBC_01310]|uniref:hypothetical protein n=1 Tax=Streptomyces sp. NBC_01310 TaxID=2903820 RepID=UPI0035B62A06
MEVQGASTADDRNVVQYTDRGVANQQWQMVKLSSGGGGCGSAPTLASGTHTMQKSRKDGPCATDSSATTAAFPRARAGQPDARHHHLLGLPRWVPVQWAAFDGGHMPGPVDDSPSESGVATWTKKEIWRFFAQFQ